MTNIEKLQHEKAQTTELYKDTVVDRILGIAALKSLINDASGETELIRRAAEKLNQAFRMEDYYTQKIEELSKQLNELQAENDKQSTEQRKENAKAILGIGGNK
jgi:endonuclease III-like uncharacterized protein